jgi:hypothetical protein
MHALPSSHVIASYIIRGNKTSKSGSHCSNPPSQAEAAAATPLLQQQQQQQLTFSSSSSHASLPLALANTGLGCPVVMKHGILQGTNGSQP